MSDGQQPTLEQSVGDRIRQARDARGWSQKRLAEEAGVSENTVLSAEKGRRRTRDEKLRPILEALGMNLPPDNVIDLTGMPAELRLFVRVLVARFSAMDDEQRLRQMNEVYAHILESEPFGP